MSLMYLCERNDPGEVVLTRRSISVPETLAKPYSGSVLCTVPGTPNSTQHLADEYGLDFEILIHKLQLYQLELEAANLRCQQREMTVENQASDGAGVTSTRDGHGREESHLWMFNPISGYSGHSRPTSFQDSGVRNSPRISLPALSTARLLRMNRPEPLKLSTTPIIPQEVHSAAVPVRRNRGKDTADDDMKRYRRRTKISARRSAGSKIIMMSSGKLEEHDFVTDSLPVPQLSTSQTTVSSPSLTSSMTPLLTEDQPHFGPNTQDIAEALNIKRSGKSSPMSQKCMPTEPVPGTEEPVDVENADQSKFPIALIAMENDFALNTPGRHLSSNKKSFLGKLDVSNDVDTLLDLYMTEEQLVEDKVQWKSHTKATKQIFFQRWQSSDNNTRQIGKPR